MLNFDCDEQKRFLIKWKRKTDSRLKLLFDRWMFFFHRKSSISSFPNQLHNYYYNVRKCWRDKKRQQYWLRAAMVTYCFFRFVAAHKHVKCGFLMAWNTQPIYSQLNYTHCKWIQFARRWNCSHFTNNMRRIIQVFV